MRCDATSIVQNGRMLMLMKKHQPPMDEMAQDSRLLPARRLTPASQTVVPHVYPFRCFKSIVTSQSSQPFDKRATPFELPPF